MTIAAADLLFATVAHAYGVVDLENLAAALRETSEEPESDNGDGGATITTADDEKIQIPPLGRALVTTKRLRPTRAADVGEATDIVRLLRDETVYGSVLLRNGFAREEHLDSALEVARREGLKRRLGEILVSQGQITQATHDEAQALVDGFLGTLDSRAVDLAAAVPWAESPSPEVVARLEVVLGEVASRIDFISREQIEATRKARRTAQTAKEVAAQVKEDLRRRASGAADAAPTESARATDEAPAPALPSEPAAPEPAAPKPEPAAAAAVPPAAAPPAPAAQGGGDAARAAAHAVAQTEAPAPSAPKPADEGGAAAAAAASSAKEPIPGYELVEKLGQGAMGAVFKATKKDIGITVALKVLKPDLAEDEEFVERFQREARSVGQLNHANIVKCYDFGKANRTTPDGKAQTLYYYAMEHVDGETLGNILKEKGPIPEKVVLSVSRQVAAALEHAWQRGIVHRDIKPENIMLTRDRVSKLTDLGLAKKTEQDNTLTMTGVVMGSPAYISPEQATGQRELDCRSDIYSLGASIYHMLTGNVPYDGETPLQVMLKHMNDPIPDPRDVIPAISSHTVELVNKMLAKKPEQRHQDHGEVAAHIAQIEAILSGAAAPSPTPRSSAGDASGSLPAPAAQNVLGEVGKQPPPAMAGGAAAAAASSAPRLGETPAGPPLSRSLQDGPMKITPRRPASQRKPATPSEQSDTSDDGGEDKDRRREIGERLRSRKRSRRS